MSTQPVTPQSAAPSPKWLVQAPDGKVIQFPDNFAQADVEREMNKMYPAQPAQTNNTISAGPKPFTLPWLKSKFYTISDAASQGLPAAGATAGAMIGAGAGTAAPGPGNVAGAIGGAGIGGMAGEAGRQLVRRALGFDAPDTSADAAKQIAKEGAIQGGIQGATEGLPFLGGYLKNAAVKQYTKALAPTTRINKAITQEIVPQLIDRGEFGSLEGLSKRAGQEVQSLSPELNSEYQALEANSPKLPVRNSQTGRMMSGTQGQLPGSGNKVLQDLEDAKSQFMAGGKVADPAGVQAIENVQDIVKQYGPNVSPTTLRELRQVFENPVAKAGGYAGNDLSTQYALNAKQTAADSIRRILNNSPSDIGALNREISFWLDVQRVTRDSALRRTGQEGGLLKVLGPLGSALAGGAGFAAHGAGTGLEAAGTTALASLAVQVSRSPAWRTASAVAKGRFADAIASGSVGNAAALAARFGVAAKNYLSSPQNGLPPILASGQSQSVQQ